MPSLNGLRAIGHGAPFLPIQRTVSINRRLSTGAIADYADLARLGHVSRARISQIMNLLQLAPDIQEQLLFLGRPKQGRDPIHLARLQPIAALVDWKRQRRSWRDLLRQTGG